MGLLVKLIIFLIRSLFRLIWIFSTRTWPRVEGEIQTSGSHNGSAEITYTYSVSNKRYSGVHKRAFSFDDSAKEYARQFIPKWKITIRYSPGDPRESFVSADDQVPPPVWATRFRE
jgi:Protein of unknown function (DUF3592)